MSGPLTRQHGFCISSTGALLSVNADMPVADALEQASNLLVCVDTLAGIAAHGGQANELFAIQYLAEMAKALVDASAGGVFDAEGGQ